MNGNTPNFQPRPSQIPPAAFTPPPKPQRNKWKVAFWVAAPLALITGCSVGAAGGSAETVKTVKVQDAAAIADARTEGYDDGYSDGFDEGTAEAEAAAQANAEAAEAEAQEADEQGTQEAEQADQSGMISAGMYEVGADIDSGRYKVTVTSGSRGGCYIERASDASGEFDSIISNDFIESGSTYVEVADGEYLTLDAGCEAAQA